MKSILMSIKPKWCELIASGKKTIEIRRTAPKEVPFKVYIYQTKSRDNFIYKNYKVDDIRSGKVIGEFICDKVVKYEEHIEEGGLYYTLENDFNEACQLDNWELHDYGKGKPLYAWHISELKIYDEPRDINFKLHKVIRGYHKKDEKSETFNDKIENLKHSDRVELKIIDKAPVSWCYVN